MSFTVIGLGEAGCNIAELFESNDTNVKLIDTNIEGDNCYSLQTLNTPEEYEKKFPDISSFLSDCDDRILFILGGGGKISGCTLKLLKHLKDKQIDILYIRDEQNTPGTEAYLQDRLVYNVLQEYTRSGVFNNFNIINNDLLEEICGNVPVKEHYKTLNKLIYNTFNTFMKLTPNSVYNNYHPPRDVAKITTYGVYDLKTDNEKLYYDLNNIENKCYYYFISKNTLETDGQLLKNIKSQMKKKVVDNLKISYIIYQTDGQDDFCYVKANSSKIQE